MDDVSGSNDICEVFRFKYSTIHNIPKYDPSVSNDRLQQAVLDLCAGDYNSTRYLDSVKSEMVGKAKRI